MREREGAAGVCKRERGRRRDRRNERRARKRDIKVQFVFFIIKLAIS